MKEVHILLIEDNDGDILLTREAFKEAKINNRITAVKDGEQALDYLYRKGTYLNADLPDLILLDINLPRLSGLEVLTQIKMDEELKAIPVIMLTTSENEADILESYKQYANCYISKPIELDMFMDVIRNIEQFWVSIVKLPAIQKSA